MRLGLKCGGTIEERAERLFGTKGMSLASLPKEYFPNNKKPKALSTN
jgi:splicing factor 3A subunit 3